MAKSLQARVAARGYPVFDVSGQSGQGTRPDSTLPAGAGAGTADPAWTNRANDPGWTPATLPAPEQYVMPGMYGLPGGRNPDSTPRTHAAPLYDSTLPRGLDYIEADAAHGGTFNGPAVRHHPGSQRSLRFSQALTEGNGATNLDPVRGQLRSNAGFDAVQGYGGGGRGPGGTNEPELTTLDRAFPGETYHNVFVSAAEVPLYVPDASQFIPTDPAMAPWLGGNFDAPTTSSRVQGIIAADTPNQGQAWSTPAMASSFWGG